MNAPATGIYTIVVGTFDTGLDGSGDYTLTATGISASMIKNGDFSQGETFWQFFATPTLAYIQHQVVNGVLDMTACRRRPVRRIPRWRSSIPASRCRPSRRS